MRPALLPRLGHPSPRFGPAPGELPPDRARQARPAARPGLPAAARPAAREGAGVPVRPGRKAGGPTVEPVGQLLPVRPGPLPPTDLKGSVGGRRPTLRGGSGRPAYPAGPGRAGPVPGLASCGCRRALPADPVLWSLESGPGYRPGRAGPGRAWIWERARVVRTCARRARPRHTHNTLQLPQDAPGGACPPLLPRPPLPPPGPGRARRGSRVGPDAGRAGCGACAAVDPAVTPGGASDDSDGRDSQARAGPATGRTGTPHGGPPRACVQRSEWREAERSGWGGGAARPTARQQAGPARGPPP
jgi:hypothetical protein